jgi:hypothetical protein
VVLALLAQACTGDEEDPVPAGLLDADAVGGGEPDTDPQLTVAVPCGPDSADLWIDSDGRVVEYEQSGREVLVGAWQAPLDATAALDAAQATMRAPDCRSGRIEPDGQTWRVTPLPGFSPDTLAFEAATMDRDGPGTVSARAYRLVDGRLVTVWVTGSDDTTSVDELRRLLDAQVALTTEQGAA